MSASTTNRLPHHLPRFPSLSSLPVPRSESQPRIHALVEELGGAPHAERPHHADIDTVAALVYERVLRERGAKVGAGARG